MVIIRQDVQYSVPSCANTNPKELQKVVIHLAMRHQFSTTNVYLPKKRPDYSYNHQRHQSCHDNLSKVPDLVCGDFNPRHSSWDDYVSANPRVFALHDWMEAHSKVVLSDGSSTPASKCDQIAGIITPEVSLVSTDMVDRFSWETISELHSDRLPYLLILDIYYYNILYNIYIYIHIILLLLLLIYIYIYIILLLLLLYYFVGIQ